MIELFAVPPGEEEAFFAAYAAEKRPDERLYRALRADARHRFASVRDGPPAGVLLVVELDARNLGAPWDAVIGAFTPCQGFVAARIDGTRAVVHWSSPLMYQRAVEANGDLIERLPFPASGALYARV